MSFHLFGPLDNAIQRFDELCRHGNISVLMHAAQRQEPMVLAEVKEEGKTCCICIEDLEKGSKERMLQCGHMFHRPCIAKWLKQKRECPICKQQV